LQAQAPFANLAASYGDRPAGEAARANIENIVNNNLCNIGSASRRVHGRSPMTPRTMDVRGRLLAEHRTGIVRWRERALAGTNGSATVLAPFAVTRSKPGADQRRL
jgi:hypothetical protein